MASRRRELYLPTAYLERLQCGMLHQYTSSAASQLRARTLKQAEARAH